VNISKDKALSTIKKSLVETQFRIRKELDIARQQCRLHMTTEKQLQLEENQDVLKIINHELLQFVEIKGIG